MVGFDDLWTSCLIQTYFLNLCKWVALFAGPSLWQLDPNFAEAGDEGDPDYLQGALGPEVYPAW